MLATDSLTNEQWQAVYGMAAMLSNEEADVNEVGKIIAYLRAYSHQEKAGARFFEYLRTLVRNGRTIGHSGKTSEYYATIEQACKQHLQSYQDDPLTMLQILGWVARMMRYYKSGGTVDFVPDSDTPNRQAEIASILESQDLKIGDVIEAEIAKIKGVKVTYEFLGGIPSTQKEPKNVNSLAVGQKVKVKVIELKNGKPKKVQLIE